MKSEIWCLIGFPLLRSEDHEWRLRGDSCKEQSSCFGPQHSLHRLIGHLGNSKTSDQKIEQRAFLRPIDIATRARHSHASIHLFFSAIQHWEHTVFLLFCWCLCQRKLLAPVFKLFHSLAVGTFWNCNLLCFGACADYGHVEDGPYHGILTDLHLRPFTHIGLYISIWIVISIVFLYTSYQFTL